MEVGVSIGSHVKVEDYIDFFNINSSSENIGGHHDSVFELLEVIVSLYSNYKIFRPVVSQLKLTSLVGEDLYGWRLRGSYLFLRFHQV